MTGNVTAVTIKLLLCEIIIQEASLSLTALTFGGCCENDSKCKQAMLVHETHVVSCMNTKHQGALKGEKPYILIYF